MQTTSKAEILSIKKNNDIVLVMLLNQQIQQIQEVSQSEVNQSTQKSIFQKNAANYTEYADQPLINISNKVNLRTMKKRKQNLQNNLNENLGKFSTYLKYKRCTSSVKQLSSGFSKTSCCISVVHKKVSKQLKYKQKQQSLVNIMNEEQNNQKSKKEVPGKNNFSQNNLENKNLNQNQQSEDKLNHFPSLESVTNDIGYETQQIANIKINNQFYINSLVGYIQDCKQDLFMAQMYMSHFLQIYDNLQSTKLLQKPENFILSKKITKCSNKQKTLVLDLDETLVHLNEYKQLKSDIFIPVNFEGKVFQAGVSVRPHAYEFLKNMSQYYEIIVFTASSSLYAESIVANLDPERNLISHCLYREDCIEISKNCHVKDLRILGRNLKDVVLVDNSANSFAYQIENGIPIIPYLDNKNDNELLNLQNYLIDLLLVDDVREINSQMLNLKIVQNCDSVQQAIKNIVSISNKAIC